MANQTIPNLPPALEITPDTLFWGVQGGRDVRVTAEQIGQIFPDGTAMQSFANLAAAQAAEISTGASAIYTASYRLPSDGGGAIYIRAASGAGVGKFQSEDGQWWSLSTAQQISVRMFGAYGNGTNDDVQPILDNISWVNAHGGGVVYFPAGSYLVNTTTRLQHAYSNILFVGESAGSVVIVNASATLPALTIGDGSTQIYGGGVTEMRFASKSGVVGLAGQAGPLVQKVGQFYLNRVQVSPFPAALHEGIILTNVSQSVVSQCEVQGCLFNGILLTGCVDIYATNNRSDVSGNSGFALDNTQGCYMANCTAYGNALNGWELNSTTPDTFPNYNNFFLNCVGDTSGSYNWSIGDSWNSQWVNCWGSTQLSAAVNTFANGFIIASRYSRNLMFTQCLAEFNNGSGFYIYDPGGSSPTYIQLLDCSFGTVGPYGNNGNGQGGTGYGLEINGASDHIRVQGGQFLANATGAVHNTSTGTDIIIGGNPLGFVTASNGTGTIATSASSATITHGLAFTPAANDIQITPTSSLAASSLTSYWVSAVSSSTFTVTANTNASGVAWSFGWRASYPGT